MTWWYENITKQLVRMQIIHNNHRTKTFKFPRVLFYQQNVNNIMFCTQQYYSISMVMIIIRSKLFKLVYKNKIVGYNKKTQNLCFNNLMIVLYCSNYVWKTPLRCIYYVVINDWTCQNVGYSCTKIHLILYKLTD